MKVLFGALHFAYFRNFESVIVSLAERGHQVHLAADEPEDLGGRALVERLAGRYPQVTCGFAPSLDAEPWFRLARKLRIGRDYVRLHDAAFAPFEKNRTHVGDRSPRAVVRWMRGPGQSPLGRRVAGALLAGAEALMPVSAASRAFIEEHDPDVVLLASVTAWRAPQLDHLRAARALGKRTGVCVFSWDHLSSKALIRVVPDRVLVWNPTQKREAIEWHRIPADRVVVTGAQCYDQWFDRRPARSRDAFCRAVGLSPDRPFVLYVCSVMTPDPHESAFVMRWIDELRRSPDARLREAGVLIRPHPERMDEWAGVSLERFGNVALYGRNPVSPDAQADYFDSLHHSHAVIGLVTSAFLEAAVVGRPVHTLMLPEFEKYQEGVQHFRYLLEVDGGLLRVSRSFPEHLDALAAELAKPEGRDERNERFVRGFVRPGGLDAPATPAFVAAVEEMASAPPLPVESPGLVHRIAQPIVRRAAVAAESGWLRPALRDTRELESDLAEAEKARRKDAATEAKTKWRAEKSRMLDERHRTRVREHRQRSQRKYVARLKGRLRTLMGQSQ